MARSITVLVETAGDHKKAGLEIETANKGWEKFEAGGANNVFKTKKGTWRKLSGGGGAFTTELLKPGGGTRVGVLRNFDPDTVGEGTSGQGLSDEAGTALTWRVDKIIE